MGSVSTVPVSEIVVGCRHRRDLGDLAGLAASLTELGMLQPIGLTPAKALVFGGRRLAAARSLGWAAVPVVVIDSLADAALALRAERDENQHRKPMTPSELVSLGTAIEALERPRAAERRRSGQRAEPPAPGGGRSAGDTRDAVASALGVGHTTYERAKAVVENGTPELVAAMDAGALAVKAAAEVAKLPAEVQREVATAPDVRAAAKTATRRPEPGPEPEVRDEPEGADERDAPADSPPGIDVSGPVVPVVDPEKPPVRDPDHPHAEFLNAIVAFATKVSRFVNDAAPDSQLRRYLLDIGFVLPRDKRVGDRHYGWQCVGLRGLYRTVKLAGLPGRTRSKNQILKAYQAALNPEPEAAK